MINSLEEAIKHCEKVAEENEGMCRVEEAMGLGLQNAEMMKCAKEHRQLAKWLRELKKYREILTRLDAMIDCYENCESCQGFREYPTSQFVKDVIQINKGVNADGDSD